MSKSPVPRLIAIVGGSGAGKSWLAAQLQTHFGGQAARLCLDSFYRDRAYLPVLRRERLNYDHPRAIDWARLESCLRACRAGRPVHIPGYDFKTHTRLAREEKWWPKPLVLVEGLWLLHRRSVRQLFDLSIFIECPSRLRLHRRLERDLAERGRTPQSIRRQFVASVAPMHEQFVAPQRRYAHLVLHTPIGEPEVAQIARQVASLLPTNLQTRLGTREGFRAQPASRSPLSTLNL